MLEGVRSFVRRHRRAIFVTGAVAGTLYVITNYIRQKFWDMQERMYSERTARENLRRRFETNQSDAAFTVLALFPAMADQIMDSARVEDIIAELQRKKGDYLRTPTASVLSVEESSAHPTEMAPTTVVSRADDEGGDIKQSGVLLPSTKSKTELWNTLKLQTLVRSMSLIYSASLLILLTRVQMNLLGRSNYVSSILSLLEKDDIAIKLQDDESQRLGIDIETDRRFLTFSWWIINQGWRAMQSRVEMSVDAVFSPLSPKDSITQDSFNTLISRTRDLIETSAPSDAEESQKYTPAYYPFAHFLMPQTENEQKQVLKQSDPDVELSEIDLSSPRWASVKRLVDETIEVLESPDASIVLGKLVDVGTQRLTQALSKEHFGLEGQRTVRLANALAAVTREAHQIAAPEANMYIEAMEQVPELRALSAIVYSSYDREALVAGTEVR